MLILLNFPNEIKLSKSNQHHPCNNTHHKRFNTQKSHQSQSAHSPSHLAAGQVLEGTNQAKTSRQIACSSLHAHRYMLVFKSQAHDKTTQFSYDRQSLNFIEDLTA